LRRAEGGGKIFGVFRVKNDDFTPKNLIFSNCGGRREKFWGISCEKSRFYAKNFFYPILVGRAPGAPPLDPPLQCKQLLLSFVTYIRFLEVHPPQLEKIRFFVVKS
jgi:hypothetical protein